MHKTITPGEMRRVETLVMERTDITGEMLMERAAAQVARTVARLCAGRPGTVICVCGTGNNGGDGYVCARLLTELSVKVTVILATGTFPGNAGYCKESFRPTRGGSLASCKNLQAESESRCGGWREKRHPRCRSIRAA